MERYPAMKVVVGGPFAAKRPEQRQKQTHQHQEAAMRFLVLGAGAYAAPTGHSTTRRANCFR
jgi:hypothetical protein